MTPIVRPHAVVVGASGFLGTHLAAVAAASGFDLTGVDLRPPRNSDLFQDFLQADIAEVDLSVVPLRRPVSHVFYLGGLASVVGSMEQPYSDFSRLLPGLARCLDFVVTKSPTTHVVYYSSAAVYGQPVRLPVSEECPLAPISAYGAHRMLAESLIENYSRIFGLTASVLRIFSAYGPFLDKMMFWDLLKKRQAAIAGGMDVIEAFGTGVETRDFIHARDIAKAALLVAQSPEMGVTRIVNVGSGVETTVAEAANMLLSCLSRPIAVKFSGATREGDPTRWVADISRLKELGFVPDQPLVDGLREYAEWFVTCQP